MNTCTHSDLRFNFKMGVQPNDYTNSLKTSYFLSCSSDTASRVSSFTLQKRHTHMHAHTQSLVKETSLQIAAVCSPGGRYSSMLAGFPLHTLKRVCEGETAAEIQVRHTLYVVLELCVFSDSLKCCAALVHIVLQ